VLGWARSAQHAAWHACASSATDAGHACISTERCSWAHRHIWCCSSHYRLPCCSSQQQQLLSALVCQQLGFSSPVEGRRGGAAPPPNPAPPPHRASASWGGVPRPPAPPSRPTAENVSRPVSVTAWVSGLARHGALRRARMPVNPSVCRRGAALVHVQAGITGYCATARRTPRPPTLPRDATVI
jgi:hypothetical protein